MSLTRGDMGALQFPPTEFPFHEALIGVHTTIHAFSLLGTPLTVFGGGWLLGTECKCFTFVQFELLFLELDQAEQNSKV